MDQIHISRRGVLAALAASTVSSAVRVEAQESDQTGRDQPIQITFHGCARFVVTGAAHLNNREYELVILYIFNDGGETLIIYIRRRIESPIFWYDFTEFVRDTSPEGLVGGATVYEITEGDPPTSELLVTRPNPYAKECYKDIFGESP